ncbi:MAG: UTP--glucose-1-phosphate uridylyltransferase [Candidatus Hydrogenedentales bacterium]
MMDTLETQLRERAAAYGQDHIFRFWDQLTESARTAFLNQIAGVDFQLLKRLSEAWIHTEKAEEHFNSILPIQLIPPVDESDGDARAALDAGEEFLRQGRVGVFVVAGGQGTRLGFPGPKGSYPVGPISKHSLFQYQAEKINKLQERYQVILPWYLMVSDSNHEATRAFFETHNFWGLKRENVFFLPQRMIPCLDPQGKLILESPGRLATSPNGHGGAIEALVDGGAVEDARKRGVELFTYSQVDNWAAKMVDPYFIGYHVLRNASMSSKCHRRNNEREAVGVHCICDGEYRVIEYSELDHYPQLLAVEESGAPVFSPGNPAIHGLSVAFVEELYRHFDVFPWHKAFKKIPCINETGEKVQPDTPNGYKFETFIFDALRFIKHPPVSLEIERIGEYTPIKQFEGINSVVAARQSMSDYWAPWFEAAGCVVPRDEQGHCAVSLEVSPAFALSRDEFAEKMCGSMAELRAGIAIHADGTQSVEKQPAPCPEDSTL